MISSWRYAVGDMQSPSSSGLFVIGLKSLVNGASQMMHVTWERSCTEDRLVCTTVAHDILAERCCAVAAMAASTASRRAAQSIVRAVMTPVHLKARCLINAEDMFGMNVRIIINSALYLFMGAVSLPGT